MLRGVEGGSRTRDPSSGQASGPSWEHGGPPGPPEAGRKAVLASLSLPWPGAMEEMPVQGGQEGVCGMQEAFEAYVSSRSALALE